MPSADTATNGGDGGGGYNENDFLMAHYIDDFLAKSLREFLREVYYSLPPIERRSLTHSDG